MKNHDKLSGKIQADAVWRYKKNDLIEEE